VKRAFGNQFVLAIIYLLSRSAPLSLHLQHLGFLLQRAVGGLSVRMGGGAKSDTQEQ
jgi:hypothetical protein